MYMSEFRLRVSSLDFRKLEVESRRRTGRHLYASTAGRRARRRRPKIEAFANNSKLFVHKSLDIKYHLVKVKRTPRAGTLFKLSQQAIGIAEGRGGGTLFFCE